MPWRGFLPLLSSPQALPPSLHTRVPPTASKRQDSLSFKEEVLFYSWYKDLQFQECLCWRRNVCWTASFSKKILWPSALPSSHLEMTPLQGCKFPKEQKKCSLGLSVLSFPQWPENQQLDLAPCGSQAHSQELSCSSYTTVIRNCHNLFQIPKTGNHGLA